MPAEEGLLKRHAVTIDAAMPSILKRDGGEAEVELLKRLAKGVEHRRRHASSWQNWIVKGPKRGANQ